VLTSILLVMTLGSPPGSPPEIAQPIEAFDPVRAEITVDDDGTLEILAYDAEDALVGALLASPSDAHVQIDASFPDGYASIGLVLVAPDPSGLPEQNLDTDLEPDLVAARISTLFGFVAPPPSGVIGQATRKQCMYIFAGVAGACGLAATLTPLSVFAAWGCVSGFASALCSCADYLPFNVC